MLFAFRSEGQLVLPPSVKRESLLSRADRSMEGVPGRYAFSRYSS